MSFDAGLRGAIVWAIVAYVLEAPFRVWLGDHHGTAELPDATTYARQVRHQGLDAEQTFPVAGKLRPVLLLQDRPRRVLPEIVALRMVRLETLSAERKTSIREQREPSLFHVPVRPAKYGLSKEMAAHGTVIYRNEGVLFDRMTWGRIREHVTYEDTQRAAGFDRRLAQRPPRRPAGSG